MASGNRFERRKQRTRREILSAAEKVLAEKGLHQVKIADIAEAADIGVGTVYLHFQTKEALTEAVVEDTVRRLKDTIDRARAGAASVVEQVRLSTQALCRFAEENRAVFRVVFGPGGAYHDVVRRAQALFAADIERTLAEGVAEGVFRVATTPAIAAQALVGMSTQLVAWWAGQDTVSIGEVEATIIDLTLRGVGRTHGGD
ncbi:MAG TPA: TetR/AcrR family transcriptional regulator [Candidatus Limnocylindria bacterium]|nr:TetR/AcrR family transcriptional regulator [Candidatus Limnocylindria bacterium]